MSYRVALVVASDKAARGERTDSCVAAMRQELPGEFSIASETIVEDDYVALQTLFKKLSDDDRVDCVIVSGGTGLGPRDVTPQAIHAVIDYEIPGIGEAMRAAHAARIPTAILSRSIAGVRKHTLIIAVPGSPNGARESLAVIAGILPHALGLLRGQIGEHSVDVKSTAPKSTAT